VTAPIGVTIEPGDEQVTRPLTSTPSSPPIARMFLFFKAATVMSCVTKRVSLPTTADRISNCREMFLKSSSAPASSMDAIGASLAPTTRCFARR
jgi:hypothetical protein